MEHILKVLSYHGQIDAQISTNSGQIRPKDPQEHKEKLQVPCYSKFSRKEMITLFTWHEMRQFQQPHHYTVCQWGFYPIVKTCKKWVMTLSSSMAMYSVMRDIPDARKRMSCSSPICHMQSFKSFDFRTNGPLNMDYLYFDTHCIPITQSTRFVFNRSRGMLFHQARLIIGLSVHDSRRRFSQVSDHHHSLLTLSVYTISVRCRKCTSYFPSRHGTSLARTRWSRLLSG